MVNDFKGLFLFAHNHSFPSGLFLILNDETGVFIAADSAPATLELVVNDLLSIPWLFLIVASFTFKVFE